ELLASLGEVRAFEALPRGARGMAVLRPFEAGIAAVTLILAREVSLDFVESAVLVARSPFRAGAIRRVVILEVVAALVIRLAHVVRAPVCFLDRRVDELSDAFAGRPAGTCPSPVAGGRNHAGIVGNTTLGKKCHLRSSDFSALGVLAVGPQLACRKLRRCC